MGLSIHCLICHTKDGCQDFRCSAERFLWGKKRAVCQNLRLVRHLIVLIPLSTMWCLTSKIWDWTIKVWNQAQAKANVRLFLQEIQVLMIIPGMPPIKTCLWSGKLTLCLLKRSITEPRSVWAVISLSKIRLRRRIEVPVIFGTGLFAETSAWIPLSATGLRWKRLSDFRRLIYAVILVVLSVRARGITPLKTIWVCT